MTLATISPTTLPNLCSSCSSKALKKVQLRSSVNWWRPPAKRLLPKALIQRNSTLPSRLQSLTCARMISRIQTVSSTRCVRFQAGSMTTHALWTTSATRTPLPTSKNLQLKRALRSCCWSSSATASTQLKLSLSPQMRERLKKKLLSWHNFAPRSLMRMSRKSEQKLRHCVWSKKHLTLQKT